MVVSGHSVAKSITVKPKCIEETPCQSQTGPTCHLHPSNLTAKSNLIAAAANSYSSGRGQPSPAQPSTTDVPCPPVLTIAATTGLPFCGASITILPISSSLNHFHTFYALLFFNDSLPRMIASVSPLLPPKHAAAVLSRTRSFSFSNITNIKFGADRVVVVNRGKMNWIRSMHVKCFKNSTNNHSRGLKVEVDSGGENFIDAAAAEARVSPEHLVIMVNGIIGSSADWRYAAEQFVKQLPDKVIVHRSECNYSKLTFDGVDLMGDRLAEEVLAVVRRRPEVQKISFVAHSLGGLVARYAIARLYENLPILAISNFPGNSLNKEHTNSKCCLEHQCEARIAGLEPMNFITVATPHLGSRGNRQLPFLCGLPFLERRASQTAHLIVGRTGKHLFLTDSDNGKPPLLLQMVNDSDSLRFISALRAFKRRVAYANVNYDHMVGWRTSSIRRQNELPKSNLLVMDQKYPHILYVEQERMDDDHNKASPVVGEETTDLEEEMIKGLTQVSWERIDVSFRKSKQRYIAHNTIQVKTYWLNSDGADVVFHMIDNFLL